MNFDAQRLADEVGAELCAMRQRAGLTKSQVAARVYRDASYRTIVNRIERGVHVPSLRTLALYAAACGGSMLDVTRAIDRAVGLP